MLLKSQIGTLVFSVLLACHIQHDNWHNKTQRGVTLHSPLTLSKGKELLSGNMSMDVQGGATVKKHQLKFGKSV